MSSARITLKISTGILECDRRFVRERAFGEQRDDHADGAISEKHFQDASGEGEQQRFGEQLPNQAAAVGANGGAHGKLMPPGSTAPTEGSTRCRIQSTEEVQWR